MPVPSEDLMDMSSGRKGGTIPDKVLTDNPDTVLHALNDELPSMRLSAIKFLIGQAIRSVSTEKGAK